MIVKQIKNLVNDSVKDALGKNASLSTLDTTDLVSLGKAISSFDAFEKFYGALANRIVKTVMFVRGYRPNNRSVLLDEHEYGAFVQKVYTVMPDSVDNPAEAVTTIDGSTGARTYSQASPYDIEAVIQVSAKTFGGQGTWGIEFMIGMEELKTAFTSEVEMMKVIDAIYMTADNKLKLDIERLEADAVNTAMAYAINKGLARNLLAEYNTLHPNNTLTVAQALEDLDFLKFASMEISRCADNMETMNVNFNGEAYETYTPRENLVVEVLSEVARRLDSYLEADTYHKEMVGLPRYNKVAFWQNPGNDATFSFTDCSSIKVKHSDIASGTPVVQSGIIAFLHDTENVAAYFGARRTWEKFNERSNVINHGEQAKKGYAVDGHANSFVFYIAEVVTEGKLKKAKEEAKA